MLDKDVIRIAEKRIQIETGEQQSSIFKEIERIRVEAASRGLGSSGVLLNNITEICAIAIKNRAQLVWQTLFRFLTTTGISYSETLAEELKALVAKYLPENIFKNIVAQDAALIGLPKFITHYDEKLDAGRQSALEKVGTEIDLFVHSLKKKVEMKEKEAASTIFNIYSPVGAIQTGDSAIANVTQTIDVQVKQQLMKVLDEISSALESDIVMPYPKAEIIEIVQEGQQELKKQSSNITKLRGMLSTVGTAIQTIASMQPAYEALKQALTFLGISLP